MNIYQRIFSLLLLLTFSLQGVAQHHWCGVSVEDQEKMKERMFKNREEVGQIAYTRGTTTYVRVQPQVVRQSDGSAGIGISQVLESICIMNEFYNEIDVHFYISSQGIRYIDNTTVYTNPSGSETFLRQRKVRDAMNIYYVGSIPSGGAGITQAFYSISSDYIVCDKDFALNENVLSHEVGHFFTLPHPFFGWESEPYDESIHGNPVSNRSPSGRLTELADGSNCQSAGDGICDTPPDYLFAFNPNQIGCTEWTGNTMDPAGTVVDPMETNLMSYFEPCLQYELTEGQKTAVLQDLNSGDRFTLRNATPSILSPVTDMVPTIAPAADDVVDGFEMINFVWNTVPNGEWYLLEIDRTLFDFNSDFLVRVLTRDTFATVELTGRRAWKYRVKSFNSAFPCSEFNEPVEFRSGENPTTSVQTISELNDWTVIPNPVRTGQPLTLSVNAAEAFEATIRVFDLVGRQVLTVPTNFATGTTATTLDLERLEQGMYIVQLESEQGMATKKLIVNQ